MSVSLCGLGARLLQPPLDYGGQLVLESWPRQGRLPLRASRPHVHVHVSMQPQLWIAAFVGDVAKVRSLLASSGGELLVDLQDKDGASAACIKCHMEVVRVLLSAGAKVNLQ